ncbi:MAG: polysaccharide deacetylase family protein, partial [Pseudomonadota bacterium]
MDINPKRPASAIQGGLRSRPGPFVIIACIGFATTVASGQVSANDQTKADPTRLAAATPASNAKTSDKRKSRDTEATCTNRFGLGVSRVIEIDPRKQTHFGSQQYRSANELLRDREVVLTFDDGPLRRHTRRVLRALKRHCTKATFFKVGRMAVADPVALREASAAGHTIGHHTWSHKNQNRLSFKRAIAEFELGVSAIQAATGKPTAPFFRFPYLADAKRMQSYITQRGFGIFSIDIDSYDWRSKSPNSVIATVMRGLRRRGKGILLFHDIQSATARSLDRLLDKFKNEGFRIVHFVPSETAVTLPEYDRVAAIRLDKRNYRSRANPLTTVYRHTAPSKAKMPTPKRAARPSAGKETETAQPATN